MSDKGVDTAIEREYRAGAASGGPTLLIVDRRLHRQRIALIGMASQLSGVPLATLIIAIEEHGVFEDDRFTIADYI